MSGGATMRARRFRSLVLGSVLGLVVWLPGANAQTAQFTKAPTGEHEVAVGQFAEGCFKALNAQNLEVWLACFSDDAKIDSKAAGGIVDKKNYESAMTMAIKNIVEISLKQAEIDLQSPAQARLTGIQELVTQPRAGGRAGSRRSSSDKILWKLEKRSGKWLIVEAKYL